MGLLVVCFLLQKRGGNLNLAFFWVWLHPGYLGYHRLRLFFDSPLWPISVGMCLRSLQMGFHGKDKWHVICKSKLEFASRGVFKVMKNLFITPRIFEPLLCYIMCTCSEVWFQPAFEEWCEHASAIFLLNLACEPTLPDDLNQTFLSGIHLPMVLWWLTPWKLTAGHSTPNDGPWNR